MKEFFITCILVLILLSCNTNNNKEKKKPILSLSYSNFPFKPIYIEFNNHNTVTLYRDSDIFNPKIYYKINPRDQEIFDSFLYVMTQNRFDETYYQTYSDYRIVEEGHIYSININTDTLKKTISIWGHTAPGRFYQFTTWASDLVNRLEKKTKSVIN